MSDDLDVEAMLEAPYQKEGEQNGSDSPKKKKRSSSRDKDRRRSRSRSRDRRDRKRRSRSRDRRRSRSKDRRHSDSRRRSRSRERRRSPGGYRGHRGGGSSYRDYHSGGGRRDRISPYRGKGAGPQKAGVWTLGRREPTEELAPEEKDARTVFCMQLAARIRPRDIEEFFSSVGKVRDVRLITDNKTRRSKGIAYVEFQDVASVPLALGLHGQKLLGVPIIVQQSQAEKNRAAGVGSVGSLLRGQPAGPMRLYIGSLHFNITEDMLRGIFEPFGKIDHINLVMDPETNRSKGFGFVSFKNAEDAMKAMSQLNGFELAGRPMKVGHVTERTDGLGGPGSLDSEEMDGRGVDLGATGRLALMAKLAAGTGFDLPAAAQNALDMTQAPPALTAQQPAPPIATQCFLLSNMFDPNTESTTNFDEEIRDDVIEECNKHGGVLHIFVDKASPQGNVYVKCPSIASAVASVSALHGRWFAGKMITAAYVPLPNYHQLFPDAQRAQQLLMPNTRAAPQAAFPM